MSTVRETNAKKDSGALVVGTIVTFVVAAFVAGVLTSGMFIGGGAPPADLKAEYCRGVGDGEARQYNAMRDFLIEIENRADAAGFEAALTVIAPDGTIVDRTKMSERPFSEAPEGLALSTEEACYALDPQVMIDRFGVRGPSDYVAPTVAP